MLAVFAIRCLVDQIILGVVLNLLISGLTGYLYDRLLVPYANTSTTPARSPRSRSPDWADIPILGPIFFDSTIFLYITYARSSRCRSACSAPAGGCGSGRSASIRIAADTVGIKV